MTEQVLVFFIRDGEVLLAQKSPTAKVAASKWNGYGGGIEPGETPLQAAVREVGEETKGGIRILVPEENLMPRGCIDFFYFENETKDPDFRVFLFVCRVFSGEPNETEEMRNPTWFAFDRIKDLDMMPADREFIPKVLDGQSVDGWVRFLPKHFLTQSDCNFGRREYSSHLVYSPEQMLLFD
jgi:8-oxo-dGTP diphosphatase